MSERLRVRVLQVAFGALLLGVWQAFTVAQDSLFLAGPWEVAVAAVDLVRTGELFTYAWPTVNVLGLGLFASLVVGIPFGYAAGRWERLFWLAEMPINLFYTTPLIALIPVLLAIFGFGTFTKALIVFLFAVFPLVINTAAGVRSLDPDLLEFAHSFNASEQSVWRDIMLPGTLPFVVTGIRLSVGRALIGAVVAEFYAGVNGIGYLIVLYSNRLDTARALVPVIVLVGVGVAIASFLRWLQKRLTPWQPEVRA